MGSNLMSHDLSLYIALAAFAVNMIGTIVGVTWKLSRVELSLRQAITIERREIDEHMERQLGEIDDRLERQSREFGETASALRQKVHEVEVWARDTFVRRDGFYKVKDELSAEIKGVAAQIYQRLDKLEAKMEARQ